MFQTIFQHLFIPCWYLQKDLKKCLQQKFVTYDPFKAGICPSSWLVSWKEAPKIVHLFPGLKSLVSKKKKGRKKSNHNFLGSVPKKWWQFNRKYMEKCPSIKHSERRAKEWNYSSVGTMGRFFVEIVSRILYFFFFLSARLPSRELTYPTPRHVWVDDFSFP